MSAVKVHPGCPTALPNTTMYIRMCYRVHTHRLMFRYTDIQPGKKNKYTHIWTRWLLSLVYTSVKVRHFCQ